MLTKRQLQSITNILVTKTKELCKGKKLRSKLNNCTVDYLLYWETGCDLDVTDISVTEHKLPDFINFITIEAIEAGIDYDILIDKIEKTKEYKQYNKVCRFVCDLSELLEKYCDEEFSFDANVLSVAEQQLQAH